MDIFKFYETLLFTELITIFQKIIYEQPVCQKLQREVINLGLRIVTFHQ